jgi:hypothetical protein
MLVLPCSQAVIPLTMLVVASGATVTVVAAGAAAVAAVPPPLVTAGATAAVGKEISIHTPVVELYCHTEPSVF